MSQEPVVIGPIEIAPVVLSAPTVVVSVPTTPIATGDEVPPGSWRCTNCGSLQKCDAVKKPSRPRRRVKGGPPASDSPVIMAFLGLFGLHHWEQFDHVWTVKDITPEKIKYYLNYIRPELVRIETGIATQQASKMILENVTSKDLVTLLKQIAKIYGYAVVSRSRVVVNPETREHLSHQEYSLQHYVAKPSKEIAQGATPQNTAIVIEAVDRSVSNGSMVTPQK